MRTIYYTQIPYLVKIIIGLLVVISACSAAFLLPESNFSNTSLVLAISLLVLFFIILFPIIYFFYWKMDELQKKFHEHASVLTLTLLITISGIVGILQANQVIPLFNQFWILGISVVVWATTLSFVDKFYKQ